MTEAVDPLLERESELTSLDAALTAVLEGSGSVVFVQGSAGIGKSRLLEAVRERAERAGVLVLSARGGELERDFAFGIARQLFEPVVVDLAPEERAEALAGAAALAAPVVGLADARAGQVAGARMATGDRLFPVLHGLYWLSANLATRRPLMIEVDDAHWADEQSVRWLAYLARRLADVPILVALATRDTEATPALSSLAAIATEPLTRTLVPEPLSAGAVAAIVAGVIGVEPLPDVARACHLRSGGNPFVVRELAAALVAHEIAPDQPGTADRVAGLLPGTVARSVLSRLGRLPQRAVALAEAAAVLGSDVQLVDAARLAGLSERRAAEALDALVAAGFLLPEPPLRFAHPLMLEAIYGELPPGRRRYEHRRAADVLTARIAPERIAAHLLQCEPRADPQSVAVLRDCGARAIERGAPETAVRFLARALLEPPAPDARGHVLRELGAAELRVGRPDAVEHLEEALTLATTPDEIAAATHELAIAISARGGISEAIGVLERGITALDGRDREAALGLEGELCALGQLDVTSTPRVAARLHRVAPDLAGETPGERLVLATYAALRSDELAPSAELLSLALRALGDGLLLREQTADSASFYLLMYVLYRAERHDLADHWLGEAVEEARTRGSVIGMSSALGARSLMRWQCGDLAAAEADAQSSMDAQVEAGWASVLPLAVATRADCMVERGEAAAAMQLFEDTGLGGPLPELQMYRWGQAARGRARVAGGRAEEGIADLLDCAREQMGRRASIALEWRTDAALALAARGDAAEARRLAEEQLELSRPPGLRRQHGIALRTLGQLSSGEESRGLLAEAVSVLESSSAALERARALVELGSCVRRAGQRGDAREHLRAGYELARRCGSTVLRERAAGELAAAGVRMRRPALTGRDALTPSERRVAEMAATGLSNPEIAQSLFVTRKTIEMHLGRVYRKLDVGGREQLAPALTADWREPVGAV